MKQPGVSGARFALGLLCCLALALSAVPSAGPAGYAQAPQPTLQRYWLPLLRHPPGPPATISFGTGQADERLIGEASNFAFGLTARHYQVRVRDAAGRLFREEWTLNGVPRPELARSGVLPAGEPGYLGAIALSTGAPLPRGVYRLRVLVDGLTSGEALANIE